MSQLGLGHAGAAEVVHGGGVQPWGCRLVICTVIAKKLVAYGDPIPGGQVWERVERESVAGN